MPSYGVIIASIKVAHCMFDVKIVLSDKNGVMCDEKLCQTKIRMFSRLNDNMQM